MSKLPAQFSALEPYADWALPSETDRYAKRLASTMDELQAFYDVAFPALTDSVEYLKSVSLEDISEENQNLLWLFSSLVTCRSRSRYGASRVFPRVARPRSTSSSNRSRKPRI